MQIGSELRWYRGIKPRPYLFMDKGGVFYFHKLMWMRCERALMEKRVNETQQVKFPARKHLNACPEKAIF